VGNTQVALKDKNSTEATLMLSTKKGDGWIEILMPIVTVSEANGGAKISYKRDGKTCYKSEHWTEKHIRHRRQKGTVALLLRPHRDCLSLPCEVKLTRYAPHKLDRFENLPMSLKWIYDAVCEIITGDYRPGRADADERISVSCDQVVSKDYGVKIRISSLPVETLDIET